jgi:holo-[acyl-carrier protein] synthase
LILGVGTDIAEVPRIRRGIEQFGDRFLARLFTPAEVAYATAKANAAERFAARFAAKEAGMKAIGTGWSRGVTWHDFEVRNQRSGRPVLNLTGVAATIAQQMGVAHISLSLTHTSEIAYAVVILEGEERGARLTALS